MAQRPILVTGANGRLGLALCRRLAEAIPPRAVRAIVRSERAAAAVRALPEHARPEVSVVDYTDSE